MRSSRAGIFYQQPNRDSLKATATKVINALLETITAELKAGREVSLVGFGAFTVKDRAARTGRNPSTGQEVEIRAARVPGFKAGKGLKEAVN
ncbi:HU family DNA-binding protein [Azotobacter vinelandii]|uniref:HU family DNA-binding protein n=1 Tax=Azotobacter vinelandii TaxID=354 RepID=UPI00266573A5|nr:HU family DNA-binding protein [Azotobacter vinelandii]WKN20558.1 HU family DNA-binding protein [Azotobacter vinelandii]